MCHLCARLLVALLTFAVGAAASLLWGLWPGSPKATPPTPAAAPVVVAAPPVLVAAPAPPVVKADARTVNAGILNVKAVSKPAPAYPAAAKAGRVQGTVVVRVVVGTDGHVESAHAVSGPPMLQEAAADAVGRWRFSPTMLSGEPVKVSGVVTVNFVLQ